MRGVWVLLGIVLVILAVIGYNHLFSKTLMFSEIVKGEDLTSNLLISTFDFDTGLTRWDVHRIKAKSGYWNRRMQEVDAIRNPALRQQENEKLIQEMLDDPQLRKIINKILPFGRDLLKTILTGLF